MKITYQIGANAYVCIEHAGRKTDILFSPSEGAAKSLREYAADQRARAARMVEMANLAEIAGFQREGRPVPEYLLNGRHNLISA